MIGMLSTKTYISPEELANKVLLEIKNKNGKLKFPIDPYRLIKESGIILRFSDFKDLEGIIITDENNNIIVGINSNRQCQRQRFTAAHEYCHFLKDIDLNDCTNQQIICKINSSSQLEKYANEFASCLLMPLNELKRQCLRYLDKDGYIDFESVTLIAEYFAVSFESCVYRIAYKLGYIKGSVDSKILKQRIKDYKPTKHRISLIKNTSDEKLLENMINNSSYNMIDLSKNTGAKFIQNYIYYDNKLEGININTETVNYILADLRYNKENSSFFNNTDEDVVMTLGNLSMQEYLITTSQELDIFKTIIMHKKLFSYSPYANEYGGYFRNNNAIINGGGTQPISYTKILEEMNNLNIELEEFLQKKDIYNINEYIKESIKIMYRFIVIHPFQDGNGRISRGLLNWLFKLKGIPPIYFDLDSKEEYYDALKEIDIKKEYTKMNVLVYKRVLNTMIKLHQYLFIEEELY